MLFQPNPVDAVRPDTRWSDALRSQFEVQLRRQVRVIVLVRLCDVVVATPGVSRNTESLLACAYQLTNTLPH